MSLILDALRKMELERKAKRQGGQEVRSEVLNYRGAPLPATRSRMLPAAVVAVAAVGAALFYITRSVPVPSDAGRVAVPINQGEPPAAAMPPQKPSLPVSQQAEPVPDIRPRQVVAPAATVEAPVLKGPPADITVTGIAWHDDRSLRRAVVNGVLVAEGGEVGGATVVEVKENRVRFSRGGESFEVVHASGTGR